MGVRWALAAGMAAVATMAAPSAGMGETVEVVTEASATHCGEVTLGASHAVSGGCPVHFISADGFRTFAHSPTGGETQTSSCTSGFTARFDEDGQGYAVNHTLLGGGCLIAACDEAAPSHVNREWPLTLMETGNDTLVLLLTLCIRPAVAAEGASLQTCTILMPATQSSHGLEFTANEEPCFEDSLKEVSVQWISDSVFDEIEVVHTP